MLITQHNRIYTDSGDFCFLDRELKKYTTMKFMLKDYTFTPYLSFTELNGVDNYHLTMNSGIQSILPGSYIRHTSVTDSAPISSIKEGDDIFLAGAYPDVQQYAPVRVPHSLCELGYFEITEPVAEVIAAAQYYGNPTDKGIIIKGIPKSLFSDEAVLFVKNFGATVFRNISSSGNTYTIKIIGNEFIEFLQMGHEISLYFMSISPRSVIKSYFKIERSKARNQRIFETSVSNIQTMLLSRFGLIGSIVDDKLVYDHDIDLSDIIPMHERYSNVVIINPALSVYRDKVIKVEKMTGMALNLLLDSDSNCRLILDNIF